MSDIKSQCLNRTPTAQGRVWTPSQYPGRAHKPKPLIRAISSPEGLARARQSFPKMLLKQALERSWVMGLGTSLSGFCCSGVTGELWGLS